jgi:hypothetical protein
MARQHDGEGPAPSVGLEAPRHSTAWASIVYAFATLTLAFPALGGRFLLNPLSDQYKAGYAFREYAAEHLKSGQGFPQWNPFLEGGMPYIAAMHGDIFYPTFLLRMIMPTDMAMTWEFPIHLFLCGLFTFLFLRAWQFGFYAALVGGLAYMLGGSIAGYAGPGHDGKLFVSTMLPLALLLLTRGVRDGRLWAWGALAITVGLAVLSPHPQLLQYMLLASGAFALYLAFATHARVGRLPRPVAIKRLALAAGAVAVGMLMGAVQYWPAVIEYKPWSPRAAGHDWETATSYSFPIEETLNAYWPHFSGILTDYWGRNAIHFHSDYFGVIVLMLIGCAFGMSERKSFKRFWIATGIVGWIWAFGGHTPLFHVIMAVVPGTKYFRAPSTMVYVPAFAMAVLAAIGTERFFARKVSPKYPLVWGAAALVFSGLMSIGGYAALSSMMISTFNAPPEYVSQLFTPRAEANASPAILGVWRSFFFVAAGAGLMWAWLNQRLAGRTVAISLVLTLIVDLWSIERLYWTFSPRASQLYATDPAIDAIKADIAKSGEPGRVWTEDRFAGGPRSVRDPIFVGDALMSHRLRIVGNYHGNELGTYVELKNVAPNERIKLSPQFWRHENVRYLYTTAGDSLIQELATQLQLPAAPVRLAGPVRNAAGNMVFAYRLPGDMQPAWVAPAIVKAPGNQALATVIDPRFDPRRVAIVDSSHSEIQAQPLQTLPEPSTIKATVSAVTDRSYDITLDQPATAGSALVVSENYYPGWQATADGKAAPVARMNFNLTGVVLPAGARNIQLRFTDAAYGKGKALTLACLTIALLAWGAGFAVEKRRPALAATPV